MYGRQAFALAPVTYPLPCTLPVVIFLLICAHAYIDLLLIECILTCIESIGTHRMGPALRFRRVSTIKDDDLIFLHIALFIALAGSTYDSSSRNNVIEPLTSIDAPLAHHCIRSPR